jgi:hypothetical protein
MHAISNVKFQLTASGGPVFTKSVSWRPLLFQYYLSCERISQQINDTLQPHIESAIKRRRQQQQQQHNINRINSLDNTAPPIKTSHPHSPIHSVASSK